MGDVVLGSGKHTYSWVEDWAKLPDGVTFGYTHGVAEDSQGRMYIHNTSEHAVIRLDADGNYIDAWGVAFAEGAHGMQYNREDDGEFLYLADIARRIVVKTTLDGEEVWTIGCPFEESGVYRQPEEFVPTNVAVAPNGDFYVADGYGKSYIHQYDKDAGYIRTFGGPGSEPGQCNCPHGLWVDLRGETPELVVADRANVRLQYFSLEGEHLRFVTHDLLHPCDFDTHEGDLLIPDLFGRVTLFDAKNKLIAHLGENAGVEHTEGYPNLPQELRLPGKFIAPHSAMWDHAGNLYVVEWIHDGRVIKLERA